MNINYLPLEILLIIFQKSTWKTRITCKLVCKLWLEIFMTRSEFTSDRLLNWNNCYFEMDRPPLNIFNKSMYSTYKCKQIKLKLNSQNYSHLNNIITDHYNVSCFEIISFVFSYKKIKSFNILLNNNENVKCLKLLNYNCLQRLIKVCSGEETDGPNEILYELLKLGRKYDNFEFNFHTVEKLIINNCFEFDLDGLFFQDNFHRYFPNLKEIYFEHFIKSSHLNDDNHHIESLAPAKYQIKMNNESQSMNSDMLLYYFLNRSAVRDNYKLPTVTCNYLSDISSNKNVTFIITNKCFTDHKQEVCSQIKKIKLIFFDKVYCVQCLEYLGKSIQDVKGIKVLNNNLGVSFPFPRLKFVNDEEIHEFDKIYKSLPIKKNFFISMNYVHENVLNLMNFVLDNYQQLISLQIYILNCTRLVLIQQQIDDITNILLKKGHKLRVSIILYYFCL